MDNSSNQQNFDFPIVLLFMTPLSLIESYIKISVDNKNLENALKRNIGKNFDELYCIYCGKKLSEKCHDTTYFEQTNMYSCSCTLSHQKVTGSIGTIIDEKMYNLLKTFITNLRNIIEFIHVYYLIKIGDEYAKKVITLKDLIFDLTMFEKLSERKRVDTATLLLQIKIQYPIYYDMIVSIDKVSDIINDENLKDYFVITSVNS